MQEKEAYVNGQKKYVQAGDLRTYFFKNGTIRAAGIFKNELMEGEWKFYRETGQLWQVGNFRNNKKHGSWVRYDKNDHLEYQETFEDDKIVKAARRKT